MREVNEKIARSANIEDDCTGRFWEGRFKCQALLDEQAILSCMAYVDLNPVRAGMAATPEESAHTSIQYRIEQWQKTQYSDEGEVEQPHQPNDLYPFVGNPRQPMPEGIAFSCIEYLELVDWSGRQVREGKRGSIDEGSPPIIERLGITAEHWMYLCTQFESRFKGLVGRVESLKQACNYYQRRRSPGLANSQMLFG